MFKKRSFAARGQQILFRAVQPNAVSAAALLAVCLAGCAPNSGPAATEPAEEAAVVAEGKVSPEAIIIFPGESRITLISKSVFPKDVAEQPDAALVNCGWSEYNTTDIVRKGDLSCGSSVGGNGN